MKQPLKRLMNWLEQNSISETKLFALQDLRILFPKLTDNAFKTLLSRATKLNAVERVCRGIYLSKIGFNDYSLVLFRAVTCLRGNEFNYLSFETVLSDAGVISQIPMNSIFLMSSGRSNKVCCGRFGTIEFVHTERKPFEVVEDLTYDAQLGLWRANVSLALSDMKRARRNCDLINWSVVNELV